MILSAEVRCRLQEVRGIYATEACDRCGQLLGPLRFTRAGESGVWCSRECRGDVDQQKIHKGGRPRKYKHDRARKNAHAQQQREFRSRSSVTKTCQQPIADKGLTGAILTSCYGGTTKPENGIIADEPDFLEMS
jgi:hypothetical protein